MLKYIFRFVYLVLGCLTFTINAVSNPQLPKLTLTKVTNKVYVAVGVTQGPNYQNWGHNNNLSVVIGKQQVLVVNGGDSYLLAKSFHNEIKKLTDKPVKWVVNENGQGHSMLGNSYWHELGVPIIAHSTAIKHFEENGANLLDRMKKRSKERAWGTFLTKADISFDDSYQINLGDTPIEVINFGPAHSAGDVSVWLPAEKTLIAGDIAFHQRLLAVFPETNSKLWLNSFEKMMLLKPINIVPGHGSPTNLATIKKYTYDYLVFLREKIALLLEQDLGLSEAYEIDQSAYSDLDTFQELAGKNAGRIFQEMEMDDF